MRYTGSSKAMLLLAAAAVLLASAAPSGAGWIEGSLLAELETTAPDTEISVLVDLVTEPVFEPAAHLDRADRRALLLRSLRHAAAAAESPMRTFLHDRGASRIVSLWAIGDLAVTAPAAVIIDLAEHPGVASIRRDLTVELSTAVKAEPAAARWNLEMVGAPEMWSRGVTGAGVVVAVIDSGVDGQHDDLAPRYRGGSNSWFDPYGQHADPHDVEGHGTQVAGVLVGGDATGSAIGVAPGAQWIAARIFDDAGLATYSAIHQAFQWVLDPDGNPATDDAPDVANNSWGFPLQANECFEEFSGDIAVLRAAGIPMAFSGGNTGPNPSTSVSPANNAGAFAIGGVDAAAAVMRSSGRGPSACDGGIFPAVVSPGDQILTADKTFGGVFPDASIVVSGTSFAAPHVAGAMALLLEAHPDATADQLEASLRAGAVDLGAQGPDNAAGWGLLDVVTAEAELAHLMAGPLVTTTYTDEAAFLAAIAGSDTVFEGFEDDAAWGEARSPATRPSVTSQTVTWSSNHADNDVTTGGGPARTGSWGFYSDPHGDQTVADPTDFITDGFTGTGATPLTAVGGWVVGIPGSRVVMVLDDDDANPINLGPVGNSHSFFGVVVEGSFATFEFRETEGTREDQKFIFIDDLTMAVSGGAANRPPEGTIVQPTTDLTVSIGEPVFFEGAASDPDGDPVTVLWDFGDGRTSDQLAPGVVSYPQEGVYSVTLTATDDKDLADPTPDTRRITVGGAPADATTGVVAGVANLPGAQGSDWHSDLYLHNASSAEVDVELMFSPAGGTAGDPERVTVGAGETRALEDLVATLFGVQASGAIHWRVDPADAALLMVSANTYNRVDAENRYGQQVAGVRWIDTPASGDSTWVPALAGPYRTNLGFGTDADCTQVVVRGYDRTGDQVAERILDVNPLSWVQLNGLFRNVFPGLIDDPDGVALADSVHRFEVVAVSGKAAAYTSVIDNATSDGSYMTGQQAAGALEVAWLPGAARISGANDSRWRSDVILMHVGGAADATTFGFFGPRSNPAGSVDTQSVTLAADESAVQEDVLGSLFGYTPPAVGSLLTVLPLASRGMVWMRTYTEEPVGGEQRTYGQAIGPRRQESMITSAIEGRVYGFSHDAGTRSNLILQNTRSADGEYLASEVRVELVASGGEILHQQDYALQPGEYRQHNRFVDDYGTGAVQSASLRVRMLSPQEAGETGGVDAMVSEVNGNNIQGTNDSRLLGAERLP